MRTFVIDFVSAAALNARDGQRSVDSSESEAILFSVSCGEFCALFHVEFRVGSKYRSRVVRCYQNSILEKLLQILAFQ